MNQDAFISLTSDGWNLNEAALQQLDTKEFDYVISSLFESNGQKADLSNNSLTLRIADRTLFIEGLLSNITGKIFTLLAALSSGIDVFFQNKPDLSLFHFLEEVEDYTIIKGDGKVFPPLNWIVTSTEENYVTTHLKRQIGVSTKVKQMNSLRDLLCDCFASISAFTSQSEASRDGKKWTPQIFVRKVQQLVSDLKANKKIQFQPKAKDLETVVVEPCIAVKLATIKPDGDLFLEEDGLKLLQGLAVPLFAVSVIGPARSGKSSLLSFVYGKANAFRVSPLVAPETRGFWIAVKEVTLHNRLKVGLLLIDTEGLYDPENGPEVAKTIARFSFLLSNLVVFNSNTVYDQNDLQVLSEGSSFLVSQQAEFPDVKIVVRNCSLQEQPLMISKIPSIVGRHQKALRDLNKGNDQICTVLFPIPTTQGGNVELANSSVGFQKQFAEFNAQVEKCIKDHYYSKRLIASHDLVTRVEQYSRIVNELKDHSVDELLIRSEMQLKFQNFKTRIKSLSRLEFEAKASTALSQVVNELKNIDVHTCSSMEVECRRLYEETRTVMLTELESEIQSEMTYVEQASTLSEMKRRWKIFDTKFYTKSNFADYELQYRNLLRVLELKEETQRREEETRRKLEQLRLVEEQKRREAEQREAMLKKQAEELAERRRLEEERRRREAAEYERQRAEAEERQKLLAQMQLLTLLSSSDDYYNPYGGPSYTSSYSSPFGSSYGLPFSPSYGSPYASSSYSSYDSSPTRRTYTCSKCGGTGHNIRTCSRRY